MTPVKNYGNSISNAIMTGKIYRLERELLRMPQADIKTVHSFKPGIYERTITIPEWTVLTGAVHLTDYTVRLEKGVIEVNTNDGMKVLTAPISFIAKAGCKRVGRVLDEEVVWTDVYENLDNCRDIKNIESRLYELSSCELGDDRAIRKIEECRKDFDLFMLQIGLSQEEMNRIVASDSDLIDMPSGYSVELRNSQIHGIGMFAVRKIAEGQPFCPGRLDDHRTPAGRYINHSPMPNATSHKQPNGDIWAVALRDIQENEEITIDYRTSVRVNCGIEIKGDLPCLVG